VETRRAVEAGDTVREQQRRRRGPVVAADLLHERGLVEALGRDRVAEQRGRAQVALADGHEAQARHIRDPAESAADDEHLAPLGTAHVREAAGPQAHPVAEVVHRARG
jgi:hypothetical protein